MMKWQFLLLVGGMVLGMATDASGGTLQAGAATSNITPKMGVPLDGLIMQIGPAKDVHDELFARCLVLGDGKTKLAFVVVDNTMVSREVLDRAKVEIENAPARPHRDVVGAHGERAVGRLRAVLVVMGLVIGAFSA